ncbi:ARS-binding protein 1 [Erysiphe neolycopersici]|uniref:ARS-binding protein 1 n=1 Tax=Erysiphe neolycopersici TaxID=212602 RepID=A0A420I2A3_9PEZI|nr:ARS-binding protein 1 [Erysiphe neolycopersici]
MARKSILEHERKELRIWYLQQQPRPSHRECIAWFEEKFHQKLTQGTISKSLSNRYSHLDDHNACSTSQNSCRTRTSRWPILEKLLFEWQKSLEAQQDGADEVNNDILIAKATEIWSQIPEYRDQPQPLFSSGWLANYKARYFSKTRQQDLLRHRHRHRHQLYQRQYYDNETSQLSSGNQEILRSDTSNLPTDETTRNLPNLSLDSSCISQAQEIRIPTPHEALKGLQTYLMFKAYQEDSKPIELRNIILQEQQLQLLIENTSKQSTLDSWLVS